MYTVMSLNLSIASVPPRHPTFITNRNIARARRRSQDFVDSNFRIEQSEAINTEQTRARKCVMTSIRCKMTFRH